MDIYIIDCVPEKAKKVKECFRDAVVPVEVLNVDFYGFMKTHNIECVVSPANSFGYMSGGYDLAIRNYFGFSLQEKVQQQIAEEWLGEQPVGTSMFVTINPRQSLIHTPTMERPKEILDPHIIYQCMRTTLITALRHQVKSIVIPIFGGATGGIPAETCGRLMRQAFDQVFSHYKF